MASTAGAESFYPLLLEPQLSEKIWGGRRLAQFVNKPLSAAKKIGESWEAWDGCRIVNGHYQGQTLGALLKDHARDILGDTLSNHAHFPLLFKYIDAQDDLSLQVHPDDDFAQRLETQPCGK